MKQLYFRSLIASLAILVSICAKAYDAHIDGIYYNFDGDYEVTVTYFSSSSVSNSRAYSGYIEIPSTVTYLGSTYNVTSIGSSAFKDCSGLTSVSIPSSVTSIGSTAFYGCSGLTSVNIPSSVTSIGSDAFGGCSGLTRIDISDLEAWIKMSKEGSWAYGTSYSLYLNGEECTSVSIPSSVTSIGGSAFYGCSSLTSVNIPSSVTSIGSSAFKDCSGLTSVSIPSSVTSIGSSAFEGCSGLTSVNIPSSVTSIGNFAFAGCI